jgi:hypothetical protein
MRSKRKLSGPLPPVRVRSEPPSIIEAIIAARGLTEDIDQLIEIAAALMDISPDEVRPHLDDVPPEPVMPKPSVRRGAPRPVVVERRFERVSLRRPQQVR